jgi:hypothetical protein
MSSVVEETFAANGCVALRGFHPRSLAAGLRRRVQDEVTRLSADATSWKSLRQLPPFQQVARLSTLVKVRDLHQTLVTPELTKLVASLVGPAAFTAQDAQLLLSPPQQGAWTLEGLSWHVDVTTERPGRLPGVQAFFLLDEVVPHGGATLALAGSHRSRPSATEAPADLRAVLRSSKELKLDLEGLGIEVIEMSGHAGDLFLMDMRVIHTPSVNSSKRLRAMATCRFLLRP